MRDIAHRKEKKKSPESPPALRDAQVGGNDAHDEVLQLLVQGVWERTGREKKNPPNSVSARRRRRLPRRPRRRLREKRLVSHLAKGGGGPPWW